MHFEADDSLYPSICRESRPANPGTGLVLTHMQDGRSDFTLQTAKQKKMRLHSTGRPEDSRAPGVLDPH